jgi:hypothetical protein
MPVLDNMIPCHALSYAEMSTQQLIQKGRKDMAATDAALNRAERLVEDTLATGTNVCAACGACVSPPRGVRVWGGGGGGRHMLRVRGWVKQRATVVLPAFVLTHHKPTQTTMLGADGCSAVGPDQAAEQDCG